MNNAKEINLPVRLHAKVLDKSVVLGKFRKIKCLLPSGSSTWNWAYTDEMLRLDYEMPANKGDEYWILGKVELVDDQLLVSLNSIERAILCLEFLSARISGNSLRFDSADIYNKIHEYSAENVKRYHNIDRFFVGKTIVQDHAELPEAKEELPAFMLRLENSKIHLYESMPLHLYESDINSVKHRFRMRAMLAWEHFSGNPEMTMFQLIQKLIANAD